MYIYVISAGADRQKIGVSNNPGGRLKQLQTGHSMRLSLEFARFTDRAVEVEACAHGIATAFRLHGEWFDVSIEMAVDIVKHAIAGTDWVYADEEWRTTGGWRFNIGDRVRCRQSWATHSLGPQPVAGTVYTVGEVYDGGQVDLTELPNDVLCFCPSLFEAAPA